MRSVSRPAAARIAFHSWSTIAGRREYPRAVGPARPRRERGASRGRQPDHARTGLDVRQHCAVAVNVLPLEQQRLGLAHARVKQEAQRGDGAVAASVHDPRLASVRAYPQFELQRGVVPQYGLATIRRREGARTRLGNLCLVPYVPILPVRLGRNRRGCLIVGEHPGHAG